MAYQFKKTIKSVNQTINQYSADDVAQALYLDGLLGEVQGVNTNRGGRMCEITAPEESTRLTLCARGLNINGEHVRFEPMVSTEMTVTFNNVPIEVDATELLAIVERHGYKIKKYNRLMIKTHGHTLGTGRCRIYVEENEEARPLPAKVVLFDGRTIGIRHRGQQLENQQDVDDVAPNPDSVAIFQRMQVQIANEAATKIKDTHQQLEASTKNLAEEEKMESDIVKCTEETTKQEGLPSYSKVLQNGKMEGAKAVNWSPKLTNLVQLTGAGLQKLSGDIRSKGHLPPKEIAPTTSNEEAENENSAEPKT